MPWATTGSCTDALYNASQRPRFWLAPRVSADCPGEGADQLAERGDLLGVADQGGDLFEHRLVGEGGVGEVVEQISAEGVLAVPDLVGAAGGLQPGGTAHVHQVHLVQGDGHAGFDDQLDTGVQKQFAGFFETATFGHGNLPGSLDSDAQWIVDVSGSWRVVEVGPTSPRWFSPPGLRRCRCDPGRSSPRSWVFLPDRFRPPATR